jgi:hypothetical protein
MVIVLNEENVDAIKKSILEKANLQDLQRRSVEIKRKTFSKV